MKYCSRCGNQLMDEAVICTKCGCAIEKANSIAPVKKESSPFEKNVKTRNDSWIPLIFGILALVDMVMFFLDNSKQYSGVFLFVKMLIYKGALDLSASPLLGVVLSIKYLKSENKIFSIIGLVFSAVSIVVKFVGFLFYWF